MARLAFCGLGQMGLPMATRLIDAGHQVTVWNRTAEKARPAVGRGAVLATRPGEAAAAAEAVITMLADPGALEEVLFGTDGLAEGLAGGSALIEMSTVGPDTVRAVAERLPKGVEMLDAPVLGTVAQAEQGRLKVFAGGAEGTYARWVGVLEALGTPKLFGPLGAGASMKLVVNSTLLALMTGLGEALALADALGLDQQVVLEVLADSPIGVPARSKRRNIETGSYPPNFKLGLALKDARLVVEAGARRGVALKVADAAREWMEAAERAGLGAMDYSAVIAHARRRPATLPAR
jgi:3-hydroxyisobutyrate dehydrogenase-like beta-hydroxyacid dehydrogenase